MLKQLAELLRTVNDGRGAAAVLARQFGVTPLEGDMLRVCGEETFYVELRPLRSVPIVEMTFDGVFVQPAVVFWPQWLIYDAAAELVLVVKVNETALTS